MKALALTFILSIIISDTLAQPREGKTRELSISGSYQSYSSGSGSSSSSAFLISPRLGVFLRKGLELEPEVILMFSSSGTVYVLNGNLSYNFIGGNKAVPFILAGYGVANTVPFFNVPMTKTDFSIGVLNVGGGLKLFLTQDVALRVEYRYQNFIGSEEESYGPYSYTRKIDVRLHTVQFGLSVLL